MWAAGADSWHTANGRADVARRGERTSVQHAVDALKSVLRGHLVGNGFYQPVQRGSRLTRDCNETVTKRSLKRRNRPGYDGTVYGASYHSQGKLMTSALPGQQSRLQASSNFVRVKTARDRPTHNCVGSIALIEVGHDLELSIAQRNYPLVNAAINGRADAQEEAIRVHMRVRLSSRSLEVDRVLAV